MVTPWSQAQSPGWGGEVRSRLAPGYRDCKLLQLSWPQHFPKSTEPLSWTLHSHAALPAGWYRPAARHARGAYHKTVPKARPRTPCPDVLRRSGGGVCSIQASCADRAVRGRSASSSVQREQRQHLTLGFGLGQGACHTGEGSVAPHRQRHMQELSLRRALLPACAGGPSKLTEPVWKNKHQGEH